MLAALWNLEVLTLKILDLDKNLQRASTGFLCEMSVDRMSLDIIYKENHVSQICKRFAWPDRN